MKKGAQQYIKLLKLDANAPEVVDALENYPSATIRGASYPQWLGEDVPTFAVKALLVTYDFRTADIAEQLSRFAKSLCERIPVLRQKGHAKWNDVDFSLPSLGRNWVYYGPTEKVLRSCSDAHAPSLLPRSTPECSQQKLMLGLCRA